jgi:hypothetical protein
MSDLKIAEFRELAERGLDVPDLAVLERRGRNLRRRRVATTAGGLALALGAGLGIANIAMDSGDTALDPATTPSPTSSTWDGVRTTLDHGEGVLLPGPQELIRDGVAVRFDAPGENWEWWGPGMGLRRTADDPHNYGASIFFLQDASARLQPCRDDRVQALGADPDQLIANVAPLLDLAHATVLQGPRVVTAFGGAAVHLRLQTNGACPDGGGGPAQLRGVVHHSPVDPAWPGQNVLDVWHVVVPGPERASMLVASWDLDGTSEHDDQRQALLDSLRIDVS